MSIKQAGNRLCGTGFVIYKDIVSVDALQEAIDFLRAGEAKAEPEPEPETEPEPEDEGEGEGEDEGEEEGKPDLESEGTPPEPTGD